MRDQQIIDFLAGLTIPEGVPEEVEVMHPYQDTGVMDLVQQFYSRYFADERMRTGLFGINPGRHGAGLTGIPFTDPKRLRDDCGIDNALRSHEPSSEYVYAVIDRMGGAASFYKRFFISSLCPLGFTADGKNLNYYDRKDLQQAMEPYIIRTLRQQIDLGLYTHTAIILGAGKNLHFFEELNRREGFFERIVGLPHPRYIIQYKRRFLDDYLAMWKKTLDKARRANERSRSRG